MSEFGAYPDVTNDYFQPNQSVFSSTALSYESARMKRGTSPNITIATKGTQYIAGIVNGDATATTWLNNYVASLKKVAAYNPQVPVYATIDHEFRVATNRGDITGASANPVTYGKALSIFFKKARAAAPNLVPTYWIVGYDRAFEGAVGDGFSNNPDAVIFDPYAHNATDTLTSITSADLSWIKSQPWYTGQPIGLGEFGMPVANGDTALAKFYTGVRASLKNLGIKWAVFFNRNRDNDHQIAGRTDGKTFPQAVTTFTRSID